MPRGAPGRFGLAGALALALGLLPGAAPAEEAAPVLALMAAQCGDPADAPPMPGGWAQVPADKAAPLIAGIAGFEARIVQVLDRPLADEADLPALLARRMGIWLAETRQGRMQAQVWQRDGVPVLTFLRAAETGVMQIVQCLLMIEDAPPALTEALARRFEILPETQGMAVRVWTGESLRGTPAGQERHSRDLLILPAWTPEATPAALLGYSLTRLPS